MKIQTKHTTKPELREGRKPAEDDSNLSLTNHTPAPRTPAPPPTPPLHLAAEEAVLLPPYQSVAPQPTAAPPTFISPLPTPSSPSQPLPALPSPSYQRSPCVGGRALKRS